MSTASPNTPLPQLWSDDTDVLYGPAPHVLRRPRGRTRAEVVELLAIFAIFTAFYFLIGYRLLSVNGVVLFDSLSTLSRADMVWWDDPGKLAAIGFTLPPLGSLVFLPFALVRPLVSSLVAIPLVSALFAGATMAILNRILVRCELKRWLRWTALVLFGANPLWAFYASNGANIVVCMFFVSVALFCFIAWHEGGETIYLTGAGAAMALAALTRYEAGIVALLLLVAFAVVAKRRNLGRAAAEGTAIAYVAPVAFALGLWTLFNWMIVGKPWQWLSLSSPTAAVNVDQAAQHGGGSIGGVASHVGQVLIGASPLALLLLPMLALLALKRRSGLAVWMGAVLLLAIVLMGADALITGDLGRVMLRDGVFVAVAALAAGAVAVRDAGSLRPAASLALVGLLALSLPLSWRAMQSYPYQNQEQAFVRAVQTGDDLTGTQSRGGYVVGLRDERQMASFIQSALGDASHAILTDNAQTYGVILLSGRPSIFVDRVQRGDGAWLQVLREPAGRVRYMLVASRNGADLIRARYPLAALGRSTTFRPVFTTSRYVLLSVPPAVPTAVQP